MDYFSIAVVSFVVSALTLFSGFGLGTLLLPIFAVYFPIPSAIALTAILHLINNLIKLALFGRFADKKWVLAFGLPAVPAALAGAWTLSYLSAADAVQTYRLSGWTFELSWLKLIIGLLIAGFSLIEMSKTNPMIFDRRHAGWGGLLSGFFGGLSGHQGVFRSAFLIQAGLGKEAFIGTGVVIACGVDLVRLGVYSKTFLPGEVHAYGGYLICAGVGALGGILAGKKWLGRITYRTVQNLVGVLLVIFGLALAAGLV